MSRSRVDRRGARRVRAASIVSPDVLLYEVTVDDSTTWTRPWTYVVPMQRSAEPLYEYACHEGHYAMEVILAGARVKEAEAEAAGR